MADFVLPDGINVHLIGDPHLGRKFEVGVPLARKGERERKQFDHFVTELSAPSDLVCIVGDLFDHPYVGFDTIDSATKAIAAAVQTRPNTTFVMMAGNHDMPRNITKVGAFDDFRDRLADRFDNLYILNQPAVIDGVAFFPWEWDKRADRQVLDLGPSTAFAAVGHWDLASFNGKDDHLAPIAALYAAFGDIPVYGGHYHVAGDYSVGDGTVHCIGSLEPYTHGEDPDGRLYVTLSREAALATVPLLIDKNVRIRLKPGEDMPSFDCLSLTFIRDKATPDEGATPNEAPVARDWSKVLTQKLAPLDPRVQAFIMDRIHVSDTEE